MDKDDEASMNRGYEKLCEVAKKLNISFSDADANETWSNGSFQTFIRHVTSCFHCGEQELDENPNITAVLEKFKESIKPAL